MDDPWDTFVVSVEYRGLIAHEEVAIDRALLTPTADGEQFVRLSIQSAADIALHTVRKRVAENQMVLECAHDWLSRPEGA